MDWRTRAALAAAALLVAACGGGSEEAPPPQPPLQALDEPRREWFFREWLGVGKARDVLRDDNVPAGELLERESFGPLGVAPPNGDMIAHGEIYSDARGKTYWVEAEAPNGDSFDETSRIGLSSALTLRQSYRKNSTAATLQLVITDARMLLIDYNSNEPLLARCPWSTAVTAPDTCFDTLYAAVSMQVFVNSKTAASPPNEPVTLYQFIDGAATLTGWGSNWTPEVTSDHDQVEARSEAGLTHRVLWRRSDFELTRSASGDAAELKLPRHFPVDVDLTLVPVGGEFTVEVTVMATTENRRSRESYAFARLRDPQNTGGIAANYSGLTPTNRPAANATAAAPPPQPCPVGASQTTAGTLQFSKPQYSLPEFGISNPVIFVTRTGGTQGTLSARLTTQDDTARAGTDFAARDYRIVFGDGDDVPRAVRLPILDDKTAQGHRQLRVVLSDAVGCGALGAQSSADVTVIDDEYRVPVLEYTVGGALTGLQGSGLVLEEVVTGSRLEPTANGNFVFGYRYETGSAYDIRVRTQPTNPAQACAVANGTGTIPGADVTNVQIQCTTVAPAGGLDPSFGAGGKVYDPGVPSARGVVVLSTGRIVVLAGMSLAAYGSDGARDTGFGVNGIAPVVFNGGLNDEAYRLTKQPDDKLIVTGRTRVGAYFNMVIKRFNADGSVDTGFGTAGQTTLNPHAVLGADARHSYAYGALVAPDGRIYVTGLGSFWSQTAAEQKVGTVVAKLNADGTPDVAFGANGTTTGSVVNGTENWSHAIGLQPDGKILVAGRVDLSPGIYAVTMRFRTDGVMDTGNPRTDEHYGRDGSGTEIFNALGSSGEDMVMLDDGSSVVATPIAETHPTLGYATRFGLIHVTQKGPPLNIHSTPIGPDHDTPHALARLPDGKLLLVGRVSSSTTVTDFGIVRYNANLSVDATFGDAGVIRVDFFGSGDGASAVAVQPDGRVVVAGLARNGSSNRLGMVRLLP